jgi:hypothetical protein
VTTKYSGLAEEDCFSINISFGEENESHYTLAEMVMYTGLYNKDSIIKHK